MSLHFLLDIEWVSLLLQLIFVLELQTYTIDLTEPLFSRTQVDTALIREFKDTQN